MKKIALIFAALFYVVAAFSGGFAQQPEKSADGWIRVHSNDGEFSIEVPAEYDYFYDKDGFLASKGSSDYELKEMSMLNAFHEETLLSFERYKGSKGGLDSFYEDDSYSRIRAEKSEFKRGGKNVKQRISETEDYYCVRQYFYSKSNIYVLTAASRKGATAASKRFLDSVVFKPDTREKPNSDAILFSRLKVSQVNLITVKKDAAELPNKTADKPVDKTPDDVTKMIVINKPRPSYTDAARMKGVQGAIRVKVAFNTNGFIPEIELVELLPEGLSRQTIFAALRMKILPKEKAGVPVSTKSTIEYHFAIY